MDKFEISGMTNAEILAATVPFDPPSAHIDVRLTPRAAREFVKRTQLDLHEVRTLLQGMDPRKATEKYAECYLDDYETAIKNLSKAIRAKKLPMPCSPTMLLRCARDYKFPIGEILLEAFLNTKRQATLANFPPAQMCVRARDKVEDRPTVERISRELWSTDRAMTCDEIIFHDLMKPYRAGSASNPGVGEFAGWSDRILREWIRAIDDNPAKGRRGRPKKSPVT